MEALPSTSQLCQGGTSNVFSVSFAHPSLVIVTQSLFRTLTKPFLNVIDFTDASPWCKPSAWCHTSYFVYFVLSDISKPPRLTDLTICSALWSSVPILVCTFCCSSDAKSCNTALFAKDDANVGTEVEMRRFQGQICRRRIFTFTVDKYRTSRFGKIWGRRAGN